MENGNYCQCPPTTGKSTRTTLTMLKSSSMWVLVSFKPIDLSHFIQTNMKIMSDVVFYEVVFMFAVCCYGILDV